MEIKPIKLSLELSLNDIDNLEQELFTRIHNFNGLCGNKATELAQKEIPNLIKLHEELSKFKKYCIEE